MSKMVERVALAIRQAGIDFDGVAMTGAAFPVRLTPKELALARAAIEAMREELVNFDTSEYTLSEAETIRRFIEENLK